MARLVRFVDGVLNRACLCSSEEAAFFLNSEEELPCLTSESRGQLLDEVGTAGYIDHAVEVALVLQQQLLVAGDALCEVSRHFVRLVERCHYDALHTSQGCRHRLGLRAKHVDVAVEECLVVGRREGADVHLCAFLASGVLTDDLCPQHTSCTQLGNLHEIDAVDAEVELDALCCQFWSHASFGQLCQVLVAPSEGIAEVLIAVSASVGELVGIHSDGTELGISGKGLNESLRVLQGFGGVLALHEHLLQRVEADAALNLLSVGTFLLEVSHEDLSQLERLALASAEVQLDAIHVDTLEQRLDILCAHLLRGDAEAEARHALVKDVERLGIGLFGAFTLDVLTDIPFVVGGFVAAHVGELTGEGVDKRQLIYIFLQVEGLHAEAFVGSPHHFLLIVRTLEVHLNLVAPFLTARGGKVRKEFFFTICHNVYKNI